jgi:fused signal recognition particle receptor
VSADDAEGKRPGFFARLKSGLSRSKSALSDGIANIFNKRNLDDETLEELEDLLITSDIGVDVAKSVADELRRTRYNKEITPEEVRAALAAEIAKILEPVAAPLSIVSEHRPHVVLMVGVNGTGKTTTIGKLAHRLRSEGKSVMLAAGDTFRAAAIEQLQIWGERTGCPVISGKVGSDAAGLAYEAVEQARAQNMDVLLIDTAGRLQNKANLMAELEKVVRVIRKLEPDAPHSTVLVLDATTGQNALNQVEVFQEVANVSGLVMTKLDGTARGGILVAIARRFGLPIHAIGVGEGIDDMQPFDADAFAEAMADVGTAAP